MTYEKMAGHKVRFDHERPSPTGSMSGSATGSATASLSYWLRSPTPHYTHGQVRQTPARVPRMSSRAQTLVPRRPEAGIHAVFIDDRGEEVFIRIPLATDRHRHHAPLHDHFGDPDPNRPICGNGELWVPGLESDGAGWRAPEFGQREERVAVAGAEGADVGVVAGQAVEVVAHLVERIVAVREKDTVSEDRHAVA